MAHSKNLREYETLTLSRVDLPPNPVGDLVWEFARSNLGNSFPLGQCTDFVIAALKAVGAQPGDLSVYPFVWGEEIPGPPQWGTWLDGYIIQFTACIFKWTAEDGSPQEWDTAEHHTAIILRPPLVCVARPPWPKIAGNPESVWLIHQNDGFPYVTQREVPLNAKTSGDFIFYRPVLPPPPHGRLR